MKKRLTAAMMTAALLASASLASAAELVTNGNFSNNLTGWDVTNTVTAQTSDDYVQHAGGSGDSGTGLFAAFGAGQSASGFISQMLSTVIGQTYTVSFNWGAFGGQGGNEQTLNVTVGNIIDAFYTTTGGHLTTALNYVFTPSGFTFKANSTSTLLTFAASGDTMNADMLLDNVSVKGPVAVPGPEAGAGLGALALGGMAFWASRRRRGSVAA